MIQKIIRGRKEWLVPEAGTYCGQTTPTARISEIVSRRTRVSQSSHSLVVVALVHGLPASPAPCLTGHSLSRQKWRRAGSLLPCPPPIG